jgi:acetyltransferase
VDTDSIAKEIVEVNKQQRKPIVCNLMTDKRQWTETVKILQEGGVPCFSLPGVAARALTALVRYNKIRSREVAEVTTFADVDKAKGKDIIDKAKEAGRNILSATEVYDILAAYKIPLANWRIAGNVEEAEKAALEIGFPVVIKADSKTIIHKSDMGGVAVNLKGGDAVKSVVMEMEKKLAADDLKFFVQKHMPDGLEVILGAKAEEGLGHLIMFGMGGIYVEVLKDVVFDITPVSATEARDMISSIKMAPLLEGVRGEKGVDQKALVEIIQRLSQLVTDLDDIKEMDLNPVIAYEDSVFVVDARISI